MSKWTRANPLAAVSGYGVPQGHFANGYTNGGDRVAMRAGGRIGFKKGCTGRAKALAMTFKKMGKARKGNA